MRNEFLTKYYTISNEQFTYGNIHIAMVKALLENSENPQIDVSQRFMELLLNKPYTTIGAYELRIAADKIDQVMKSRSNAK